jgi:acetyl/propionyl-CoA carboxylase alpha subunit
MKVVYQEDEFLEQLQLAKQEALKSFGDDRVLLEKYLIRPRHIEVQVFSDCHDQHFILFERECSIQRRNQKIVEETPSPAAFLTVEKKKELFEKSRRLIKNIHYVGAGTIEYIFDEEGNDYFLEMNTRLQVEHPVTEMTTGIDLVRWQILAAQGKKIPYSPEQMIQKGHSIEVRLYAEDAWNDHRPSVGKIVEVGNVIMNGARSEMSYENGNEISIFFDPMCAKLVTWGEDRQTAIDKMIDYLEQVRFAGVITNREYLKNILSHEKFQKGLLSTSFLLDYAKDLEKREKWTDEELASLMAGVLFAERQNHSLLLDEVQDSEKEIGNSRELWKQGMTFSF